MTRFIDARTGKRLVGAIALTICFLIAMRVAVRGSIPSWGAAILVPASFIALASVFVSFRSTAFVVIAIGAAIALPTLGTFGLIDPWESHYAEVAREMIERRDWVSPWWANEGWFMSKPVLVFWLEGLSMILFGVRTGPDQMILGGRAHPEWAIRFPHFLLALVCAVALYDCVARLAGKRAGLLAAIVLWTTPGYALLSHQAMTDMPLVAGIGGSLALGLRALSTNDAVMVDHYILDLRTSSRREITLHAGHLFALLIALAIIPQLLMLLAAHVHVDPSGALDVGPDRLLAGSPHACGLPSQPACGPMRIAHPRLTPMVQVSLWLPGAAWLLLRVSTEKRVARLLALGAWFLASLGAMAKGPAGLFVPAVALLVHVVLKTRRPRDLLRLEIVTGIILAVSIIGPWYLAIYARHGRGFLDELVMRHMLGRTLDHLHDTNEGEDTGIVYFVRQLGYATFPWSGAALVALLTAAGTTQRPRGTDDRSQRAMARSLFCTAAIMAFTLVSAMRTKFHHYALIVLPSAAALTGMWLDEVIAIAATRENRSHSARAHATTLAIFVAAVVAALVALDVTRTPQRFIHLLTYRYNRAWPSTISLTTAIGALASAFIVAFLVGGVVSRWRKLCVVASSAAAIGFAMLLLDVYLPRCASDGGQRDVIAAFYADRASHDPLIAYQLNWKGENVYTGNNIAIFITSGPRLRAYLDHERRGKTTYFVTERARVQLLRNELGSSARSFTELTPRSVSAEFTLIRAEL